MNTETQQDNLITPADIIKIENKLRLKRMKILDRLAREAWGAGDEDASIRFRFEWWGAFQAMDNPVEDLREQMRFNCSTDRELEEIRKWCEAYDARRLSDQQLPTGGENGNG